MRFPCRLTGEDWLVELLLEHAPPEGYAPVPGGVLDADTAWQQALAGAIALKPLRPDTVSLLEWTLDATRVARFLALPEPVRERIARHLETVAGSAAGLAMGAVARGHGPDAVALGLVLEVVLADDTERELRDAAVRLEPVLGRRLDRQAALRLSAAAAQVVERLRDRDSVGAEACQTRAYEWLERLHIDRFAHRSDHVAAGFDQRLAEAADALRRAVESTASLEVAESDVKEALDHRQARLEENRAERLRMALRLVRWLRCPPAPMDGRASLAQLAASYAREGGFVDLARSALFGGEHRADVSAAYESIATLATAQRERTNEAFARALLAWNREKTPMDGVLPVEHFLDRILLPVARASPALLIVLDGLSFAVYRALQSDLVRQGWRELMPENYVEMPPLIAALPSVTEVSRTSLLTGRLTRGSAQEEASGFAQHPDLLSVSRSGRPPLLFHKSGLGTAAGVTEDVRAAVADTQRHIVGVVHNAVDAQLAGSDQLDDRWSLDALRFLRALLRCARDAGRTVVIASDHGHVLDHGSAYVKAEGGARWREPDEGIAPYELTFEGGRVLCPTGERRVVLQWSENIRYGAKSRGYHGGASAQEIVAPLAVFCVGEAPKDWTFAPPVQPEWWDRTTTTAPQRRPSKPVDRQPDLFSQDQEESASDWVATLLATDTYAAQKRLAGRIAPQNDLIADLLRALDGRGGRLSVTALAQALRRPMIRMSGIVSGAARVLNVDQARILHLDRASETVSLDRALLERQFELGRG